MDKDDLEISSEERLRVMLQVDHFIDLLSKRYRIDPSEVAETVRWVKERKTMTNRMESGAIVAILGIVISALLFALWEGIKHYIGGARND